MGANPEILRKARRLIADPDRWTTGAFGRDEFDNEVHKCDEAYSFCALGALSKAAGCDSLDYYQERAPFEYHLLGECARMIDPEYGIASVNDRFGHERVLETYDCAIAKAEAAQ